MPFSFVIIEDEFRDFKMISEAIYAVYKDAHITPGNTENEFKEFKKSYLKFLSKPKAEDCIKDLKQRIFLTPDFFIIDFSLLDQINKMDYYGGIFRQLFVKSYYREAKVIFFSKYSQTYIEQFMEPEDAFFSKLSFNDSVTVSKYWQDNIAYYTQP